MKRTALTLMVVVAALVPVFGQQTDSATVTVYRPKRVVYGRMIKPSIYCDGVQLERISNGTFFVANIPSGRHMISSGRSEVGQFVDFAPGKRYYFRFGFQRWVTGFAGAPPVTLSVVPEDQAVKEMHGLKKNIK
jgi:hypothetical protein